MKKLSSVSHKKKEMIEALNSQYVISVIWQHQNSEIQVISFKHSENKLIESWNKKY